MRVIALSPFFAFALASVIFGVVMFVRIGDQQRRINAELQSIRAGQVQPETLTVIRKYTYTPRHGSPYLHVVFRDAHKGELNNLTSQQFYNAARPGTQAMGYHFPDGYVIPQSLEAPTQNTEAGRWFFLIAGVLMGAVIFAYAILSLARSAATPSVSLTDAILARMNQSSDV